MIKLIVVLLLVFWSTSAGEPPMANGGIEHLNGLSKPGIEQEDRSGGVNPALRKRDG